MARKKKAARKPENSTESGTTPSAPQSGQGADNFVIGSTPPAVTPSPKPALIDGNGETSRAFTFEGDGFSYECPKGVRFRRWVKDTVHPDHKRQVREMAGVPA